LRSSRVPSKKKKYSVIVFNDDVNSFDTVISSLMEICSHNYVQAVQCANIIHDRGSYVVYSGTLEDCTMTRSYLQQEGLHTELVLQD